MSVMPRPGPIVVAAFTVECDRHRHQVSVVTDGARVASSVNHRSSHGVTRRGSLLTVPCPGSQPHTGEDCDGLVTVDMADHTAWRPATTEDASWLDTGAQDVDHA